MANKFKVPIQASIDTGQLKALVDRLISLNKTAGRTAVKKGMNEVMKVVLESAKKKVPIRSGLLRKLLGRKVVIGKGGQQVWGIVKPRGGKIWVSRPPDFVTAHPQRVTKDGKVQFQVNRRATLRWQGQRVNPARYAHLVEFGRVSVSIKEKKILSTGKGGVVFGKKVKAVAPRPFMRPAWADNQAMTVPTLHRYLKKAVIVEWLKSRAKVPAIKAKRS